MSADPEVLYVCTNVDCRSRGSQQMIERLRVLLDERGIAAAIEPIMCFSACNVGPNVVIPARRCWLSGVTDDKARTLVDYLQGRAQASELQAGNDPVLEQMIFELVDAGLLEKA